MLIPISGEKERTHYHPLLGQARLTAFLALAIEPP